MSDLVVDSSVVAKWILPEADSAKAHQLIVQAAAISRSPAGALTADEPLFNALHADFPRVVLLRDLR